MRQEKQLLLDEIQEKIEGSAAFVMARFQGLSATAADELRGTMAQAGGDMEVVRKRVFLKAAESAGVEGIDLKALPGSIAVVFIDEDPVAATKSVCKFQTDHKDILEVLGGRFDGQIVGADEVEKLSKLPSMDELRAQFVGVLEAPMVQTVGVMDALLKSVLYCIDNKAQKES